MKIDTGLASARAVALSVATAIVLCVCGVLGDELWHQVAAGLPSMRRTSILGVPFQTAQLSVADALRTDETLIVVVLVLLAATILAWTQHLRSLSH